MNRRVGEETKRAFDELRALELPANQFAVFGSGPMGVRGLRDVGDVDVIVTPELFAELARQHRVEDHEHGLLRIQVGKVEILNGWYPDVGPIEALIANAERIDGLPFVTLDKVVEWKSRYGRPKDGPDLEVIHRYLVEVDRAARAALAGRDARVALEPGAQSLTMEQFLPILTDAVVRDPPATLYVSVGEADVTAPWLRRRYDAAQKPRLERMVVLRMRDEAIAALEQRSLLAKGFGDRLAENLATLHDLLAARGIAFEVRQVDRIPAFHGYLYGDLLFWGSWTADDRGYLHHRGDALCYRRDSAPERFAEAMAVFDAAQAVPYDRRPRAREKRALTVGVLTPLREEWEELTRVFPVVERKSNGFHYALESGNEQVQLVGTYVGEMGPLPASRCTGQMIDSLGPDLIVLAGIAGALDKDVQLGDVVAATEVNQFGAAAKAVDDDQRFKLSYSGRHFGPEFVLSECYRHFSQTGDLYPRWQSAAGRARQALGLPAGDLPRDHAGHIASGDTVGAAEAFAVELLGIDRKFLALEMEAAGVAAAASERANPVWWTVVRGISDFSDQRKAALDAVGRGAWRRYAMHNAAQYLRALLGWRDLLAHLEMRPR